MAGIIDILVSQPSQAIKLITRPRELRRIFVQPRRPQPWSDLAVSISLVVFFPGVVAVFLGVIVVQQFKKCWPALSFKFRYASKFLQRLVRPGHRSLGDIQGPPIAGKTHKLISLPTFTWTSSKTPKEELWEELHRVDRAPMQKPGQTTITDVLIYDILVELSTHMHYEDFVNLSLTSKEINQLVFSRSDLQYHQKLFKKNTCNPERKSLCVACGIQLCVVSLLRPTILIHKS